MTEYEHRGETFRPDSETVEIPDDAVGITTDVIGGLACVNYLVPVEDGGDDA